MPASGKLDGELLSRGQRGSRGSGGESIGGGDGQSEESVLCLQPLHAADGYQRQGEAVACGTGTVSLSIEGGGCLNACGRVEAGGLGGETKEAFAQMQLSDIGGASIVRPRLLTRGGGWREGEFGGDFVQGVLRVRETELETEEGGFGGLRVGGLGRRRGVGVDERLGFQYKGIKIEHDEPWGVVSGRIGSTRINGRSTRGGSQGTGLIYCRPFPEGPIA